MKKQDHSKLFIQAMEIKNLPYFKQEKSQKVMTLIMTLFLLVVFGFFAISPTVSTIAQLNKQIEDSQQVSNSYKTKIQNLSILHDKYAALSDTLPIIYNAIPEDPKTTYFVGQIQQIGKNTSVTISSIDILQVDLQNQAPQAGTNSYEFIINALGTTDELQSFLQNLATMDRIMTFDSISYTAKLSSQNSFDLSLRGKVYMKK